MDAISSVVQLAAAAPAGSVQGAAAMSVMKKSMQLQGQAAMELLASVPTPPAQPALATSGNLGTQLNAFA